MDAEPGGESINKDGMVDGIKGCRKVEKAKASDLLFADGTNNGVVKREENRFCGVELGVG